MAMSSQKPTVLIVDDAPENITILGELLRSDFTVKVATNGEKALAIAASDTDIDLILLDVVMPGLDGYEVCRRLKADPSSQSIPIMFITAKSSELDEVKGFELGAVDYITKPFSPIVVRARVRTHAELKQYRDFLKNTSYLDGLTAIANRRHFDEYLEAVWNLAVREAAALSLILMDIDYFKRYNDNYGHQAGDSCLVRIARQLAATLKRKVDLVARFGGEEFVFVLPNTDTVGAAKFAEELRSNVESLHIPHEFSSAAGYVTISLGAATIVPTPELQRDVLLRAADQALYESKKNGRNRATVREVGR